MTDLYSSERIENRATDELRESLEQARGRLPHAHPTKAVYPSESPHGPRFPLILFRKSTELTAPHKPMSM
jgi:hypothetical protein